MSTLFKIELETTLPYMRTLFRVGEGKKFGVLTGQARIMAHEKRKRVNFQKAPRKCTREKVRANEDGVESQ